MLSFPIFQRLKVLGRGYFWPKSNCRKSLEIFPIKPEPHLESSHSLANEWGAFELDRFTVNCLGSTRSESGLDSKLYIKWLEAKFSLTTTIKSDDDCLPIEFDATNKRILFIDDEWSKRWNSVLKQIFKKAGCKDDDFVCCEELTKGLSDYKTLELVKAKIKSRDHWDLILLDLRLTDDDHNKEDNFVGEQILEFIKGKGTEEKPGYNNPTLPVIMFTASTKARIIDKLYEQGADGHFIKHSPSDSRTPEKVKESVKAFLDTVKNCFEKGAWLQPYWKRIEEIKKNNLIKGNERTVNGQSTKFEERMIERLTMFVGLLKKAYEQTDFDRNTFFYDQNETAFLTLWSCLNEISEFFFAKEEDSGELVWSINNQGIGLVFLHQVGYDSFCKFDIPTPALSVRDRVPADITKVVDRKLKVDYHNSLQIQIAFLIYKSLAHRNAFDNIYFGGKGKMYDASSPLGRNQSQQEWQKNKSEILTILSKSNSKRNKLNLTHASDSEIEYTETVRNSTVKVSPEETENLFKVILFLTTGNFPSKA